MTPTLAVICPRCKKLLAVMRWTDAGPGALLAAHVCVSVSGDPNVPAETDGAPVQWVAQVTAGVA